MVAVDRLGNVLVVFRGFHDLRGGIEPRELVDLGLQFGNLGSERLQFMDAGDAWAAASTPVLARYASAAASDCANTSRSPPAWLPLLSPAGV